MRVIWFIDNKYRELYGLYDLKNKLLDHKIKLYFFHLQVWKTAIDLVNPHIIVVPNLFRTSCNPIVKYASKKKIDIFMHSSEGMFYTDEVQEEKYPIHLIKKINKILVWSKLDAKFLIKKGFTNKVIVSGNLKFDKKNYIKKKEKNKKIKIIGIPTHSRVISGNGISKNNIPHLIRNLMENHEAARIGYLKFELEYIQTLVNVLKEIGKEFQVVIKASPFEDQKIYEKTFPEIKIYQGDNIGDFLKNIDVILNVFSSTAVDALKLNIPVISITKLINWDKTVLADKSRGPFAKSGAVALAIQPKNITELKKLLKKDKKKLLKLCQNKDFFRKADKLAYTCDTLGIFTNLFIEYQKKITPKYINYFMFLKYIAVEIRQILFRRKRNKQLYNFWSFKDKKLLESFKIK
jgi:surface carbohydrate biosynthesis protein